jgi:mannose-6-phosphate isomerase-like protein (cupin superfamily)/uncharacterized protein YndB with AHSA1/START domain
VIHRTSSRAIAAMTTDGEVLDLSPMGLRVEIREQRDEVLEFDVLGSAKGFLAEPHVHARQTERLEVVEGELELQVGGRTHVLRPGEATEVPPGATHRQRGSGRVRIQVRPAGSTLGFLRCVADMCATGQHTRGGFPRPVAGARMVRDFGDEGHAARPSLRVQKALASAILFVASPEYVFVDEWDVAAPPEAVWDALADASTYPEWWRPVYIEVSTAGPPAVGSVSEQHFKGRLPYHLNTRSEIVRAERPRVVEAEVDGDLRGEGTWTLTPLRGGGTHVRFDWRVHADRRLLRVLTPVLRPVFRWNHNWAIARAMEGLEPYAASSRA